MASSGALIARRRSRSRRFTAIASAVARNWRWFATWSTHRKMPSGDFRRSSWVAIRRWPARRLAALGGPEACRGTDSHRANDHRQEGGRDWLGDSGMCPEDELNARCEERCRSIVQAQPGGFGDCEESLLCVGLDAFRQRPGAGGEDLFRRLDEDRGRARRNSRFHGKARAEVDREVAVEPMDYEITPKK